MPENDLETVLAYLRNAGRYENLETLKENLRTQGYDPAVIEEASVLYLNEYFRGNHQPRPGCLRTFLGCFVALVLSTLAVFSLLLSLCGGQGMTDHKGLTDSGLLMIVCAVLILLVFVTLYYTFSVKRK